MRLTTRYQLARGLPRGLLSILILLMLSSIALAGRPRFIMGDPGSAGSIPYAGMPLSSSNPIVPYKVTIGQVVDSERLPVAGVLVVIMLSGEPIVAGVMTNSNGLFGINLPDLPGLTLSLPLEGIFDVPISAGDPILVVLP